MRVKQLGVLCVAFGGSALLLPGTVQAIGLPDSSNTASCSGAPCLGITNSAGSGSGISGTGTIGVQGSSSSVSGVKGIGTSVSANGVFATSVGVALIAQTTGVNYDAIYAAANSNSWPTAAVHGVSNGSGVGVLGEDGGVSGGHGVAGLATGGSSMGVFGEGTGTGGYGVYGFSSASGGYGVYGFNNASGYAIYANGAAGGDN